MNSIMRALGTVAVAGAAALAIPAVAQACELHDAAETATAPDHGYAPYLPENASDAVTLAWLSAPTWPAG
ncbi:hypothetical protein [Yinghuangia soli]|uniref:Uncharacterized protein n=1 Tax=Yinghuangia soli TaxID=2908204 RepID=A0AA41Q723_9ACTN|nr:hypothetical protein [Yinghuangia soli]MCF2531891.1 hypothetical protein [Yinghuangia soli]